MGGLSFVTLLAYDYRYAFTAIRSYYEIADEIVLGVDRERMTWAGNSFVIDMAEVERELAAIDVGKKVRIVEGEIHSAGDAMANDTGERNALSLECAEGNWVVQIDADEILINPAEFRKWILEKEPTVGVMARWITVFKLFEKQALVIHPASEWTTVATRLRGAYVLARSTAEERVESPLRLLHFRWGRSPAELREKFANWSHRGDFDVEAYYRFWESVTLENYQGVKDFHPLHGWMWKGLKTAELRRG
jgi:glycosyltransferase involved in cell wall biosynthesis